MDIIRRKANTEYIVLQKAAIKTGYASDYIGWLIRAGKVRGKKVYTGASWQVETGELIKYCQKKKNLVFRDFSVFKKKYLSLKESAEISGYAPDYIGWLIRTGKIKGKKVYTGISWQTTEEAIRDYQERKKRKKIFFNFPSYIKLIHLVPESGNKVFGFGWRLSLTALIIFFLVSGFAPIKFLHSSLISAITAGETKTINYYPAVSSGDWQNPENVQALPEVGSSGDINSFNENNSAVYKTGPLTLIIEGFVVEEELGEKEPIIIEEEKTEELEVIPEEVQENETPETEEEIFNPELQTSLFETFKRFFGFKAYAQENTFSAKIKLSFAIGEKESDIQIIENQEIEPVPSNSEPTGFWNKTKNFFSILGNKISQIVESLEIKDFLVVKAEEGQVENGSLPAEEMLSHLDSRIIIWWSLDGQDWQQLVTISDYPLSNFLNGGYFEYEVPFLKDFEDVKNLKIKFEGVVGSETNIVAYLDSVWVEVEYKEEKEEEEEEFELIAIKKDWQANETPTFEILAKGEKKTENIIEKLAGQVSSFFIEKPEIKVKADIAFPQGEIQSLKEDKDFKAETHSPTKITIFRPEDFRPGRYNLKIEFEKNGKIHILEQDFTWGVLVINVNKSIYLPQEKAYLQMAVLDEEGRTICGADLTLEITASDGTKTTFKTEGQQETTSTLEATTTEATTTEITIIEATTTEATSTELTTTTEESATTSISEIATTTYTENGSLKSETSTSEIQESESTPEITTSTISFWDKIKNPFAILEAKAADNSSVGVIERSPECGPSSVTYTPDYYTYYNVEGPGVYQLNLTATTKNGTRSITDSFEVRESVPFDVERIGPTRIFPPATYEMILRIKANQDFKGEVVETVPTSFEIINPPIDTNIKLNDTNKEIIWDVNWKAGESYELKYQFDALDISPYIYLLGPLTFEENENLLNKLKEIITETDASVVFSEARQWQIAADASGRRVKTVEFFAGQYKGSATNQNENAVLSFSSPATSTINIPESNIDIKNAYVQLEAQIGATTARTYYGIIIYFDSCVSPCTPSPAAFLTNQGTNIIGTNSGESRYVQSLANVTSEGTLDTFTGGTLTAQVQYCFSTSTSGGCTGTAAANIQAAHAKLVVTYEYDATSTTGVNTVIYPLMSTSTVDSGSKRAEQAACTMDSNCPKFDFNVDAPEAQTTVSQWFEIQQHAEKTTSGTADLSVTPQIDGFTSGSVHYSEDALNRNSGWKRWFVNNLAGFATSTAKKFEYGIAGNYWTATLMGGEVYYTYTYSYSAPTKTRTVVYPVGIICGTACTSKSSLTGPTVYFGESGVTVKSAYFRIRTSHGGSTTNGTIRVTTKVGDNTESGDYDYAMGAGTYPVSENGYFIHVIPSSDYAKLASGEQAAQMTAYWAATAGGGISAELVVTYTYTGEDSGYLVYQSLFSGQKTGTMLADATQYSTGQNVTTTMPETTGTKTIRGASMEMSLNLTDDDTTIEADPDISTNLGTTTCTAQTGPAEMLIDKYGATYGEVENMGMFKDVTSVVGNSNATYTACAVLDDPSGAPADVYAGNHAMVLRIVYQWQAPQAPIPILNQNHYRWRNNSTALNTDGGWLAATDTSYTSLQKATTTRLRVEIANTGTVAATGTQYQLEYAGKVGVSCGDDETFSAVPTTTASAHFVMATSTQYSDNATITTFFLTPTGTSTDGKGVTYPSNKTAVFDLTDGYYTEFEYAIQATTNAISGQAYCFRLTNNGATTTFTYDIHPEVQIYISPPNITQRAYIFRSDDGGRGYGGTGMSNANTTSTEVKKGQRMIARIQVDNTGVTSTDVYKLQYDKNDNNWTDVRRQGEIHYNRSYSGRDEDAIPYPAAGSCTGGTTWTDGEFYENRNRTDAFVLGPNKCTEFGFLVDTSSSTVDTTYRLRLINLTASSTLDTYTYNPSFTIVSSGNDTQRYSKSLQANEPLTIGQLKYLLDKQGYENINIDDSARDILNNVIMDTPTSTYDTYLEYASTDDANFGRSVSSGDVNGDGYDDLIVGAQQSDLKATAAGAAFIYYGGPSMSTTSTYDVYLEYPSTDTDAYFGNSVDATGDVNKDGYNDIIVGAYSSNIKTTDVGAAFIYYGSSTMPTTSTYGVYLEYPGTDASGFGYAVSSAGDVNNDGYDDVIVGAYLSSAKQASGGAAYIYYGSSAMLTTSTNNVYIAYPETDAGRFGRSVSSAGDVNSDGYDDVIIGAYYSNIKASLVGAAYILRGSSSLTSTENPDVYLQYPGADTGVMLGWSVSSAGDVNGDGYDDVIVGAYSCDFKVANAGAAFIYYGGSSMSPTSSYNVYLEYPGTDDAFSGNSVSSADVNGDGYSDLIVGAYLSDLKLSAGGATFIYYGYSSMPTTSTYDVYLEYPGSDISADSGYDVFSGDINGDGYPDVISGAFISDINATDTGAAFIYWGGRNMDTTSTYEHYLQYAGTNAAYLGGSVSSAGDVNGDGYDDVVVGAYQCNFKALGAGAAFIYYGGPSMSTTSTYNVYLEYPGTDDAYLGRSVSSAGDVNGDGYDDVVVGAWGYDLKAVDAGAAFIYYGGPSMLTTSTYNVYLEYASTDTNANFGTSVSSAGDVNGDGYADVVVGAYRSNLKAVDAGAAFIYYGGPSMSTTSTYNVYLQYASTDVAFFGESVSSAGDVNGDGYDDVVVGADYSDLKASNAGAAFIYYGGPSMSTTSTYNVYLQYASTDDAFFGQSVSSAGDVNGDGYADVVVGAQYSDLKFSNAGAAFIYYGGPSMLTTSTYNVYLEYASTDVASFGQSVSSAGDVNGDGYDDVVVGAEISDLKAVDAGAAFIYYGGSSMSTTSTYDVYLQYPSTDDGRLGHSVSSAGDVNGDGYNDVVVGAFWSDLKATNAGAAFLYMGAKSISSPYFYFAEKVSGTPSNIDAAWNGQSSINASTKNLKLDVYRFGTTQWENATTNSSCATNTDCTLSKSITTNVSEYYSSGWTYWRAYQTSGNQILKSDYFNATSEAAAAIDISGNVYTNEGQTTTTDTSIVALAINSTKTATTSISDGSYQFTGRSINSSDIVTVFWDTNGGNKAVTVTKGVSASVSDFHLYQNRVIVRHEGSNALTIANMNYYDNGQDTDIQFTAATSTPNTLSVDANAMLYIWPTKTFAPGGNVTIDSGGSGDWWDGSLKITASSTFTATSTESHSIGGSWFASSTAIFTAASSTITFTATTTDKTVTTAGNSFYNLTFNGANGGWTFQGSATSTNNFTISSGTVTGPSAGTIAVGNNWLNNGGTFTHNNSTVRFYATDSGNTITSGGSSFWKVQFNGSGGYWTITDLMRVSASNATDTLVIKQGTVQMGDGNGDDLEVLGKFIVGDGTGNATFTTAVLPQGQSLTIHINASSSPSDCLNCIVQVGASSGSGTFNLKKNTILKFNSYSSVQSGLEVESTGYLWIEGEQATTSAVYLISEDTASTTITVSGNPWSGIDFTGMHLRISNTASSTTAFGKIYDVLGNATNTIRINATTSLTDTAPDVQSGIACSGNAVCMINVAENLIATSGQATGRYLYNITNTKWYLIATSTEAATDTIGIITNSPDDFTTMDDGDSVRIVDDIKLSDTFEILDYAQVTAHPDNHGYIYAKAGSETLIRYADISELGVDDSAGENKRYGVVFRSVNGANANEGVTVEKSKIHKGYDGVFLWDATNNTEISNNGTYNNGDVGFYLYSSSNNNTLTSNNSYGDTYGFVLNVNSNNNNLISNNNYGKSYGFVIDTSSSNNNLTFNNSYGNSNYGFYLSSTSSNNTLTSNNGYGNRYGFYLYSSSNNTLISNNSYGNSVDGFRLDLSSNNILTSNYGYGNRYGFNLYDSSNNNILTLNNSYGNSTGGFRLYSSSNNILTLNNSYGNSNFGGFYLQSSSNNTLTSNNNYGNLAGLYIFRSTGTIIVNDNYATNTIADIYFNESVSGSTIRCYSCTLASPTSTIGINYDGAYFASFKHNGISTSTKIWGEYTIPDNDPETPQNEAINKFNYANNLWEDSIARVNFYDSTSTANPTSTKDTNLNFNFFGSGYGTTSATYRVVYSTSTNWWTIYRNEIEMATTTNGATATDTTYNLSFKIEEDPTYPYTTNDTYTFVAFKKSNNQDYQKFLTIMQDGDKFTVASGTVLEIKGSGQNSSDITKVGYNPGSGFWSFYNQTVSELIFQEAEINSVQFATGTVTVLNTILNNESVTSTAILNSDWYLGVHAVMVDSTSTPVATGTVTIYSSSTAAATIWKHNGTNWGSASTTQITTTTASGFIPQPGSDGAIRIREYLKTSSATTTYKYNLQISAAGFSSYNYWTDFGNQYITSVSSTESTSTVDKCISENWRRYDIDVNNTPEPTINYPPTNGTWYAGMSSDLEFGLDKTTVDLGILSDINYLTATGTTILYVTTTAPNGYLITVYAGNDGAMTTSTYSIPRLNVSNATPTSWTSTCWQGDYCGFGYTTDDNNLAGGTADRFATSTKYAGFTSSTEEVADRPGGSWYGAQNKITYKVSASPTQKPAKDYTATIHYICTANY